MTGKLPLPAQLRWSELASRAPHDVLSSTTTTPTWAYSSIVRTVDQVAALNAQHGKHFYLSSLIDISLVDELHLITYPILARPGTSLFERLE